MSTTGFKPLLTKTLREVQGFEDPFFLTFQQLFKSQSHSPRYGKYTISSCKCSPHNLLKAFKRLNRSEFHEEPQLNSLSENGGVEKMVIQDDTIGIKKSLLVLWILLIAALVLICRLGLKYLKYKKQSEARSNPSRGSSSNNFQTNIKVDSKLNLAYNLPIKGKSIDRDNKIKFAELVESEDETKLRKSSSLSNELISEINPQIERYLEQNKYNSKYEELEVLNKSLLKEVCAARYIVDGNIYTIKKVHINLDKDQDLKQHKAYKEIETMIKLNHQNIICYMTCWLEKSRVGRPATNKTSLTLYIQMEYRRSLKYYLAKRTYIDIKKIKNYFRQIMEGIKVIHANGLVHGNISADSVFIDEEDNVKFGDFSLAGSTRDDVYATGLLLLELCCLLRTDRDKIIVLQALEKERKLPKELQGTPEGELILRITETNRPTAEEITKFYCLGD